MFCFYCGIFENNGPGGGALARYFCLKDRGFAVSLCIGGGKIALSKHSPGVCLGGLVRPGIDLCY